MWDNGEYRVNYLSMKEIVSELGETMKNREKIEQRER